MRKREETPAAPAADPAAASTKSSAGRDRRKFERFSMGDCTLILYREGLMSVFGLKKDNVGRALLDLSEGGARVLTSERVAIGTRVHLRLEIAKYADQVEATGEVRWSNQDPRRPKDFYAGIQFVKMDPVHARKLINMKNWFTSPQYRLKRETAVRTRADDPLKKLKLD